MKLPISEMNKLMMYVSDDAPMDMALFCRVLKIVEEDGGDWFRAITCLHDITLTLNKIADRVDEACDTITSRLDK